MTKILIILQIVLGICVLLLASWFLQRRFELRYEEAYYSGLNKGFNMSTTTSSPPLYNFIDYEGRLNAIEDTSMMTGLVVNVNGNYRLVSPEKYYELFPEEH